MIIVKDFQGLSVRLSDERALHIMEHPEMKGMTEAIEETLANPLEVVESLSDPDAHLYYRFYLGTKVGDKYLCVVVKISEKDAFVLTAYLTDSIKKGRILWSKR